MELRPNLSRNNKKKIFNDPVYGFITIPDEFIFDLIEHPFMQRLRRIMQLGLSHLVYPGALHTRFHHAIGAMHLMQQALSSIRRKGHVITNEEERAVLIAILMHDIGHGPFSHALEYDIVSKVSHEEISNILINCLADEFGDDLTRAAKIYSNEYAKPFLYQLVSSQLDMDRLDYLNRDSFYTGVSEGIIGSDRIIEMLNVHDGNLVLEEKGIYSIEKFIVARRIMYWQVYMHKTVVSAEFMLIHVLRRAKKLVKLGIPVFASDTLQFFLANDVSKKDFMDDEAVIHLFTNLDDYDILGAIKVWQNHPDKVLSMLSRGLVNRKLFKIEIAKDPFTPDRIQLEKEIAKKTYGLSDEEVEYFIYTNNLSNSAYNQHKQNINILLKNGEIIELGKASDNLNISALAEPVEKFFLCYPVKS